MFTALRVKLVAFLFGGMLGTVFGVALGFFFFPFVFPPPPAAEMLTPADQGRRVATGTFIHANPSDPVHYGKGRVSVYQRAVFLEADFEVGPGPAFHVYLVPAAIISLRLLTPRTSHENNFRQSQFSANPVPQRHPRSLEVV